MASPIALRRLLTHALVAAGALAAGLLLGGRGTHPEADDGAAQAVSAAPDASVRTWAAAQVEARARGLPILLLLSPPHHLCPPAQSLLDLLFQGEGAARVAASAVLANLEVDREKPTREASALLARVGRYALPCLLVVAPEGDILQRQFSDLYPIYEVDLSPRTPIAHQPLYDVERVVALVDAAVGRGRREKRRIEALRAAADPVGWVEAAELLEGRGHVETAALEAVRAAATDLPAAAALRAAQLLQRLNRQPAAQTALVAALARSPGQPERDRMALLLDRVEGLPARRLATSHIPTLAEVLQAAQERQDAPRVLDARARMAVTAHIRGDRRTLEADLAWCREHLAALPRDATEGVPVLEDLLLLAEVAGQPAARVQLLKALMERYPEHPAAQDPKHCTLGAAEVKAGLRQD